MNYLYTSTVWAVAIATLFIGGASVAGTWICSDLQGNEVYTDHNGPRCKEFQPTNTDEIVKTPSAKTRQAPTRRSSDAVPFSLRSFGERKSSAITELDHKDAIY